MRSLFEYRLCNLDSARYRKHRKSKETLLRFLLVRSRQAGIDSIFEEVTGYGNFFPEDKACSAVDLLDSGLGDLVGDFVIWSNCVRGGSRDRGSNNRAGGSTNHGLPLSDLEGFSKSRSEYHYGYILYMAHDRGFSWVSCTFRPVNEILLEASKVAVSALIAWYSYKWPKEEA